MLIEVVLPVPVEEAWAHLREPALIRRWFGWEYDGLAREIPDAQRLRRGRRHAPAPHRPLGRVVG